MIEARTQRPLFRPRENRRSISYNLSFLQSYVQFYILLDVIRGEDHQVRSHFIYIQAIWVVVIRVTNIRFVEKGQSLSLQ